ncbi:MAG TPA: ATP-binding cassette domain-containing protein, partial [Spirochaetia bacterium]|nr:ATP-binding cassette domain-containing protein [Spirochaetia bacterium]
VIGLARGLSRTVEILIDPLLRFFQSVPPLLWAIPVLFIAGFGFFTPIPVIVLIVLPVVTMSFSEQIKTLPDSAREMVALFAPGPVPFLRELILPHVRPAFIASVQLGLGLAVKAAVVGEFFSAGGGAGQMINAAFQTARLRSLYAWGLVIVVLVIGLDAVVKRTIRAVAPARDTIRRNERRFFERRIPAVRRAEPQAPLSPISASARRSSSIHGRDGKNVSHETRNRDAGAIRLTRVAFAYRGTTSVDPIPDVFQNLSLTIGKKKVAIIYGDSGVGKTTLLKLIAGLLAPGRGTVVAPRERPSFLFQEDRLLDHRTVAGNAALPLPTRGPEAGLAVAWTFSLLERIGLAAVCWAFPDELSGGMKRRLQLARCFARPPSLLLLDEPFHGLHKKARCDLWEEFLTLWKESPCPAVFVTHHPEELPRLEFISFYELTPQGLIRNR